MAVVTRGLVQTAVSALLIAVTACAANSTARSHVPTGTSALSPLPPAAGAPAVTAVSTLTPIATPNREQELENIRLSCVTLAASAQIAGQLTFSTVDRLYAGDRAVLAELRDANFSGALGEYGQAHTRCRGLAEIASANFSSPLGQRSLGASCLSTIDEFDLVVRSYLALMAAVQSGQNPGSAGLFNVYRADYRAVLFNPAGGAVAIACSHFAESLRREVPTAPPAATPVAPTLAARASVSAAPTPAVTAASLLIATAADLPLTGLSLGNIDSEIFPMYPSCGATKPASRFYLAAPTSPLSSAITRIDLCDDVSHAAVALKLRSQCLLGDPITVGVSRLISLPQVGDSSFACQGPPKASGEQTYVVYALQQRVLVQAQVTRRATTSNAIASDAVVALARAQIAVVERTMR